MARMVRSILWALAPVGVIWLLAGCSGGGGGDEQAGVQEEQSAAGPVTTGEFVGDIPQADAFVSLVAEEAEGTQEVRAYLCDGRQLNEWFWGSASGEELQLASENGVQLDATLASEGASGTLTLSDGESFEFLAAPATGVEGFYPVTVSPDGQLSGTTWGGARVEGQVTGQGHLSAAFTPPEGEAVDLEASDPILQVGEEWRWIGLTEGGQLRLKGSKVGKSGGLSVGHPDTGFTGGGTDPSDSR